MPATLKIASDRAEIRNLYRKILKAVIIENLCQFKTCDCHSNGKPRCRTYCEIVRYLNSNGVKSPQGKKWHRNTVQRLLESTS